MTEIRKEIVRLYTEGLSVSEVAQEVSRDRKTIYTHLKAAGVELRGHQPSKATHCRKGMHEFTPENTKIDKNGNRHCRQCDRDYQLIRYYSVSL